MYHCQDTAFVAGKRNISHVKSSELQL